MELKTLEDCFKFLETQKDVNLRWLTSYKKFILTRKENCLQEKHHVVPNCLLKNNFTVKLSFREHFIAHLLLHRAFPSSLSLFVPVYYMSEDGKRTSRQFSSLKEEAKIFFSSEEFRKSCKRGGENVWKKEGFREKKIAQLHKTFGSDSGRKEVSERQKLKWQDSEYVEKTLNSRTSEEQTLRRKKQMQAQVESWLSDPLYHKKQSLKAKKQWQDPDFRRTVTESARNEWKNPEVREKLLRSLYKRWEDPTYREKRKSAMRDLWKDPDYRLMMTVKRLRRIPIDKRTEVSKRKLATLEKEAEMRGINL